MADAKISALTAIDAVAGVDLFPIVDDPGGTPVTKKATAAQIKDYILGLANTWAETQTFANVVIGSSNTLAFSTDLSIGRRAAANLRLGGTDAASPVAQTLSVQSVVAGTSNTAGENWTFDGSQGTGTGAGGSIIFRVAPAGSSGTAQNALATALKINADLSVTFGGNTLAQRNGTNAQAFRLYKTFTDASNYERLSLNWTTTSNVLTIATEAAGTGTARNIAIMGGKLGVGTTSPEAAMDVVASAFPVMQTVRNTSLTSGTIGDTGSGVASAFVLTTQTSGDMGDGFGGSFLFYLADNGASGAPTSAQARITAQRDGADDAAALGFYTKAVSSYGLARLLIRGNGNVRIGSAALATSATTGFLYVPSCAGTPSGTPTTETGTVPIIVDTTNHKLYFYSGGTWRDAGP